MFSIVSFLLILQIAKGAINCSSYCSTVNEWCNGTLSQFYPAPSGSPTVCETVCPTYINTGNSSSWDSADCRLLHLGYITTLYQNTTVHCPHAGPTGGNVCSDPWNEYCDLILASCTGDNTAFLDKPTCLANAYAYPSDSSANLYQAPNAKDSLQCRIYHAALAAFYTDPTLKMQHCTHANATGGLGNTCGTPCQNYCDTIQMYCNGTNAQFMDASSCLTACASYPQNYSNILTAPVTAGDSLECRKYHALLASMASAGGPTVHCPHAGPKGGGVCVSTTGSFGSAPEVSWGIIGFLLLIAFI